KEEGGRLITLGAEIRKLKEDARRLNRPRDWQLAALLDSVEETGRGSFDGPRRMGPYTLEQDDLHSFRFRGGGPVRVVCRVTKGGPVTLLVRELVSQNDSKQLGERTGHGALEINWAPQATRDLLIDVFLDDSTQSAVYELYKS